MCDRNQALRIFNEVYEACHPLFGGVLKEAYLYGSYARGDYHEASDIDILLAVDLDPLEIAKFRNAVAAISSDLSLKHDITVSVTMKPLEQFQKYADVLPFYKNVIKEGVRYGS